MGGWVHGEIGGECVVLRVVSEVLRGFCAWWTRTRAAQPSVCLSTRCKTRGRGGASEFGQVVGWDVNVDCVSDC